ncbi:MAG: sensor histidine kinase [Thaumarchaeota archaeon]|nr:sensor histidine kinase [Nitrososphaerota archaeon]
MERLGKLDSVQLAGFGFGQFASAENILENYWAKLNINLVGKDLKFEVDFNYSDEKNEPNEFKTSFNNNISNGIYADIRFFPKRAGIFHGKDFNGQIAWTWVRDNAGVGVIDHGFRLKPYGFRDDDWLNLDVDHSHSERNWRSDLMKDNFPMSEEQKKSPSFNPMLNISVNYQLVGAVFVESYQIGQKATSDLDLIPAMDREGFISNKAYGELQEIIRAGIEYLALVDKKEELKKADKKAKKATSDLRNDIRIAMKEIELNEAIPQSERTQIIETYSRLSKEIETVEEYHKTSKENLELISLLGIVSGYMTHETGKILNELKTVKNNLEKISKQYPQFKDTSVTVNNSIEQLELQIGYSTQFIDSLHRREVKSFPAKAQVEYILEKFGNFAFKKGIQHKIEIDDELLTPPLHVAMYSGIFLNLYTNAVKAILMKDINPNEGKILIRAVNLRGKHILEVFDNGVGIPESLKERIWDPLFTTTSRLNSPLGTGMGLGLSLVKKVLDDINASIKLVDPIQDYVTTIRVEYILNPFERR